MTSDELLTLFQRGFIPGPQESEAAFLQRVQNRPSLFLPEWQELSCSLKKKWGFSVDWVPIIYSSNKLLPWEGAVFWAEEPPRIQLRPSLQFKTLWGNSRAEILSHEAVHAAREAFNEPKFEEFLAYMNSSSRWKGWVGPFFHHPWDFPLFAIATLFFSPFPLVSATFFLWLFGRFLYHYRLLLKIKKKFPSSVLICLTDEEIKRGDLLHMLPDSPREKLVCLLSPCKKQL